MVSRSHIVLISLSSRVNLATGSRLTSEMTGVCSLGAHFMAHASHTSHFQHDYLITFSHLPLFLAFLPNVAFEKQSYNTISSFQGTQKKLNIWKPFIHDIALSKGDQASCPGLPQEHLCLVTISLATGFPMASWRSFWSSNSFQACLLLPLWLINITSFSVCLSEIMDYCSAKVEWQRVLMNFRKKRPKNICNALKRKSLKTSLSLLPAFL